MAAAWLAVLIPPMLRSRVENRPNSSVTDFRRQLTRLQNTSAPQRTGVRAFSRPLAPSPLGRPGQPQLRSGVTRHATANERAAEAGRDEFYDDDLLEAPRFRSHGDPTGGQRRPMQRQPRQLHRQAVDVRERPMRDHTGGQRRSAGDLDARREQSRDHSGGMRRHGDPTGGQRRLAHDRTGGQRRPMERDATGGIRTEAKQRRLNIVFVLAIVALCSFFLAATTATEVMTYVFVLSALALGGYVIMLRQATVREQQGSNDRWFESY